ncbi:triphosphoribosyl-dephospho-CoA synthase [Paraburkholderia phytofirmans]|uniref:triphosphoribosyl-dephospho-CoA synthase n=1 Tax=Paraburkholderia phytofirmans TaxID=261302 RepID=UPI0038B702A7
MRENLAINDTQPRREASGLAERLSAQVVAALIAEVTLAPKPGLVDIRSQGAHHDLDWKRMCTSVLTLQPIFAEPARPICLPPPSFSTGFRPKPLI